MLRITVMTQTEEEVVLKVEGWISEEYVAPLEQEGARWFQKAKRLVLDLTDVQIIDGQGIALLQHWSGDQLVLRGGSLFIRSLLMTHRLV